MRMPDFIIIGAMKCATSTLHEQLARQPGIHMSEPKEPNFFSDDNTWKKGIEWYSWLFETARRTDMCGESSTHYTKLPTYPETIDRMKAHLPDNTRFIYLIRHPIERLVSHYIHEWTQRVIEDDIDDAIDEHPELIAYSRYSMQLRPYLDAFGRDAVLPVFFDQLAEDPQKVLEEVCWFIGYDRPVKWVEDVEKQNASGERLRTSALRDAVVKFPGMAALRRTFVPKPVRDRIKKAWTMKERPELTRRKERYVRDIFDADLAVLGGWMGLQMNCENFKEVARSAVPRWIAPPRETAA